jgi:hypothetical protein
VKKMANEISSMESRIHCSDGTPEIKFLESNGTRWITIGEWPMGVTIIVGNFKSFVEKLLEAHHAFEYGVGIRKEDDKECS